MLHVVHASGTTTVLNEEQVSLEQVADVVERYPKIHIFQEDVDG